MFGYPKQSTFATAQTARTKVYWSDIAKFLPIILIAFAKPIAVAAEESYGAVKLENDLFLGRDGGGYTNGIFFSKLRVAAVGERGVEPPLLLKAIVSWLGMPRSTQTMITPRDIELRDPAPDDVPYVGMLAFRSTHVFVDNNIADMLALNLGVTGPASGAEQTQRFAHRLVNATRPEGWDSQHHNRALISIEAYRGWRHPFGTRGFGQASGDIVALAGGMPGSRDASLGSTVLLRYGTGLERSFPTAMRITGRTANGIRTIRRSA